VIFVKNITLTVLNDCEVSKDELEEVKAITMTVNATKIKIHNSLFIKYTGDNHEKNENTFSNYTFIIGRIVLNISISIV